MRKSKQLKPRPVTVLDKHYDETDEIYAAFFRCPKCEGSIEHNDNYCCNCGVKLNWNVKKEYSTY